MKTILIHTDIYSQAGDSINLVMMKSSYTYREVHSSLFTTFALFIQCRYHGNPNAPPPYTCLDIFTQDNDNALSYMSTYLMTKMGF